MGRPDARRERVARELGLVTLESAAARTGYPVPVLRRWVRTARLPVFLLGADILLCPDLVGEIAGSGRGCGDAPDPGRAP
jgi:hypothetical protein